MIHSRINTIRIPLASALLCIAVVASRATNAAEVAAPLVLDAVVLRPMAEAEVPARQVGVLADIAVDEGAVVEKDAELASLDDRAAKLRVEKAEFERDQIAAKAKNNLRIEYADKALEVARAELARSHESIEKFARSISQSQLDVERLTVEKLELERRQAEEDIALDQIRLKEKEAALSAARLELALHHVRAPFAGVVALVRGREGEWVEPGTAVVRLVGVDSLRAEGFAGAGDVALLQVGAPVEFLRSGANQAPFHGVIRFVSPEVDPVTEQIRIWAEIDNRDRRLRPGEQGQMQITARPDARSAAATEPK